MQIHLPWGKEKNQGLKGNCLIREGIQFSKPKCLSFGRGNAGTFFRIEVLANTIDYVPTYTMIVQVEAGSQGTHQLPAQPRRPPGPHPHPNACSAEIQQVHQGGISVIQRVFHCINSVKVKSHMDLLIGAEKAFVNI